MTFKDATARNININKAPQGFRLEAADQADVVLVQPNGIATVRLPPYLGWEQLRDRSKTVWKIWKRKTTFNRIARLGVRYVNRIDIPSEGLIDIEQYFSIHPKIPDQVNTEISSYLVQVTLGTSIQKWTAKITTTSSEPIMIGYTSFLLDIDVFRTEDITSKPENLWNMIEEARKVKNEMFENCITDLTRALFRR